MEAELFANGASVSVLGGGCQLRTPHTTERRSRSWCRRSAHGGSKQEAVEKRRVETPLRVAQRSKPATTLAGSHARREIQVVSQQDNGKAFSVSSTIRISRKEKRQWGS
ncbi:cell adhesion molecule 4 isoform X1 [Lates japonicus]|uniref:Cell adhesion molecule 4 isoform X1 n=1 Tax=Lates japonicus TaxID=270547 RepID=A0AAD3N0J6_LATJO|nr:cell adhesion molecule 4 isoform X1 [Lates japonicus]